MFRQEEKVQKNQIVKIRSILGITATRMKIPSEIYPYFNKEFFAKGNFSAILRLL
jgi:hypothetical protein